MDDDGWFPTRDAGYLDEGGFLFLEGRADDIIVRGGENMSPGEIEDVLIGHEAVSDVAIVGVPDEEWGEAVVGAVVLEPGATVEVETLQALVKDHMRSSRVPERLEFWDELPYTETGKLLRPDRAGAVGGLKTTIEIPDELANAARGACRQGEHHASFADRGGIHMVLRADQEAVPSRLRDAGVGGRGLGAAYRYADWPRIREAILRRAWWLIATDTTLWRTHTAPTPNGTVRRGRGLSWPRGDESAAGLIERQEPP